MSNAQNPAVAADLAGADPAQGTNSRARTGRRRTGNVGGMSRGQNILRYVVLSIGALLFLFPFYYMVIGSLQTAPDPTIAGAFPNPANITGQNYVDINSRINLFQGLVNSGIFAGGVILCTVVFGVLVGYALAQLEWRGRGVTFGLMLLVQVIPFQLLMIPLYVMIARDYGLADTYAGMILPFAINSTAVLVFRQYFLQVPRALFDAARIDGAGELKILWSIALPLVRPALLTVVLLTFIGPWNEFLWPFLITKEASLQPLAVSLANYLTNIAGTAANPIGAVLAGACVLAAPMVILFIIFQKHFVSSDIGSGVKG
jgi:multiple sugar transport system permease protein